AGPAGARAAPTASSRRNECSPASAEKKDVSARAKGPAGTAGEHFGVEHVAAEEDPADDVGFLLGVMGVLAEPAGREHVAAALGAPRGAARQLGVLLEGTE